METKKIPTYEEFMASMAELRESQRESSEQMKETDRRMEETDRRMKETDEQMKKTDEQMKETGKKIEKLYATVSGISDNIGYHAEQYFQNVFADKLSFGGIKYEFMYPNMKYQRKGTSAEFDIVLLNGKSVAIIEAKNRIHPKFIEEIAEEKVKQFRKYFPVYKDYDLYLGVAGFSFDDSVAKEAEKYGVGIIRQVGDAVEMDDKNLKVY
jgi:AraC-like DNA-binding protein